MSNRIDRPFRDEESSIRMPIYSPRRGIFTIPEPGILEDPVYCFKVNAEWVGHIIGMFMALDQPDAWQGTATEIEDARNEVRKLIASIDICEDVSMKPCMPIGTVFTAVVDSIEGCLLCDGATYFAEDYPDLYAVLPDRYKVDPFFSVPNMQGRVAVGVTPANGDIPALEIGDNGGAWKHALTGSENGAHAHTITTQRYLNYNLTPMGGGSQVIPRVESAPANPVTSNSGSGNKHNNAQPYLALNYFIVAIPDCGDQSMAEQLRFRQNPTNTCLFEYSINEGSNWSTAFDYSKCTPMELNQILTNQVEAERLLNELLDRWDGTPESIAPDGIYGDANDALRDAAQCYALRVMVSAALDALADNKDNLTRASLFAGAIVVIGAFAAFWTAGLSLAVAAAIAGSAFLISAASFAAINDVELRDTDAREEIICCAMNNLRGNTPTQALFETAFTGCGTLSTTAEKQRAIMEEMTQDLNLYLAYLAAVQEGYGLAEKGLIEDDCCAAPAIEVVVDAVTGTPSEIALSGGTYQITWSGDYQYGVTSSDLGDGLYVTDDAWLTWEQALSNNRNRLQYRQGTGSWQEFTPVPPRSAVNYTFELTLAAGDWQFRIFDNSYFGNAGELVLYISLVG